MDVRVGLWRRQSAEELMLLNCGVGEDSWESLGLQGDPTSPFEDQPWDFFWRNDAKAETPVLWPPHTKSWLIGKDFDAVRDWWQEKGTTEDEMAGWYHWLDAHQSGWTPGDGDGQGGLACCNSWGRKESDTTERLNWTVQHLGYTCMKKYLLFIWNSNLTGFVFLGHPVLKNLPASSGDTGSAPGLGRFHMPRNLKLCATTTESTP